MKYFKREFIDFFNKLSGNNNKEWFHAHKSDYGNFVKTPFEKFISDFIAKISMHENLNGITARDCILRINRDIRFSNDKSPYNLYVTAFVSQGGRKDKTIPGIFLRFAPDMVGIMGGCYGPSNEQINYIRSYIADNLSEFKACYTNTNFTEKFDSIKGEAIKRIPEEIKIISEQEKLILNKQWYFVTEQKASILFSANLLDEIMSYYYAAKPLNDFLKQAIKVN